MTKCVRLVVLGALVAAVGCDKKADPRDRPNFTDTSDPSKVGGTMEAAPKAGKNPTALGGAGPGMAKPGGK